MKTDYHYGIAIALRRKQLGITQAELAEQTGIGLRTLQQIEQGTDTVTIGRILTVCQALGIQSISISK